MSDDDSYFYDKAEPKYKSDEEKRRNRREADIMRGQEAQASRESNREAREALRRLESDD